MKLDMGKLGVQLYTVRDSLEKNPEETIKRIAEIGYSQVEVLNQGLEDIYPVLSQYGIKTVSGHVEAPLVTGNWDLWEIPSPPGRMEDWWRRAIERFERFGLTNLVIAYLDPDERGDLDFYKDLADKMNRFGALCRDAGIRLLYHNHSFEFEPGEGSSPIETLLEVWDPELVGLELDVFWVDSTGVDPVEFIQKNRSRIPLIHLKDGAPGLKKTYCEEIEPDEFREIGYGRLDFRSILQTTLDSDIDYFYVEQDYCREDSLKSLERSFDYLSSLDF